MNFFRTDVANLPAQTISVEVTYKEREKMMEEAYIRSELPHSPDHDKIDKLLIELHEEFLYQK